MSITIGQTYNSGYGPVTVIEPDGKDWWKVRTADGTEMPVAGWQIGFQTHSAYARPAIIAMYPTRGGWRAGCDCGWMEADVHRSQAAAQRASARHAREMKAQLALPGTDKENN